MRSAERENQIDDASGTRVCDMNGSGVWRRDAAARLHNEEIALASDDVI